MILALPRYIVAIPLAIVVTIALFFVMRALVTTPYRLPEESETVSIQITRQEKRETQVEDDLFEPPSAQDTPPPPPLDIEAAAPSDLSGTPLALPGMEGIRFGAGTVISSDTPTLIFIPTDTYPPSLSGTIKYQVRVLVQYDVTDAGTTANIKILQVDPPNASDLFRQAAIRAFERAKFKPPLDEKGNPKATYNNQIWYTFDPEQT